MTRKIALILFAFICTAAVCAAQPRNIGIRVGATGLDATYQHSTNPRQFVEANIGLDFGYNANGKAGMKASAIYNFIWARPAWTQKGRWALYAGPGLALGYANDIAPYDFEVGKIGCTDNGFMFAIAGQVGLEYQFWFPLALAIDIRPYFGIHVSGGKINDPYSNAIIYRENKVGFYDNGLLGFAPTISVKYSF